jgi:hypothetical protein
MTWKKRNLAYKSQSAALSETDGQIICPFTILSLECIQWRMSQVLTVRIEPGLLAQADAQAVRLGLDRAGYVRSLIEHDLQTATAQPRRQFVSEDLVGAFRLGGEPATNRRAREVLRQRALSKRETHR